VHASVFFSLSLSRLIVETLRQAFTSDKPVIRMVSRLLPVCGAFILLDGCQCVGQGVMRGLGRQKLGSGIDSTLCHLLEPVPVLCVLLNHVVCMVSRWRRRVLLCITSQRLCARIRCPPAPAGSVGWHGHRVSVRDGVRVPTTTSLSVL
jgi:Na+-driven multidrug efflux pump